jgi:hypothetical protein
MFAEGEDPGGRRLMPPMTTQRAAAKFSPLDRLFNSIFGDSFTSVLEFESNLAHGTDLQHLMVQDPSKGYQLLRMVFVFEEAVDALLSNVYGKLNEQASTPEHRELLTLLHRVKNSRFAS